MNFVEEILIELVEMTSAVADIHLEQLKIAKEIKNIADFYSQMAEERNRRYEELRSK